MRYGLLAALLLATAGSAASQSTAQYDVVVYGGTAAAVTAAVQARAMGRSVVIVSPDLHLGGLSSGGLGFTDTGDKAVIGGLAREFYHRVWQHYDKLDAWRWEPRDQFGNKGQGTPAIDGAARTMWIFEPHVAEQIFEDLIREYDIPVHRDQWLDRASGVTKTGARITAITTRAGRRYAGRMFIDATYEGDLMAAAGVDYHVGREASSVYGEQWNGVQTGVLHHRHHFGVLPTPVSPYLVPGNPASGVLPRISKEPPGAHGQGDTRIQAYCFRLCLSDHPDNRLPFQKPAGYDPAQDELMLRILATGWRETFQKFDRVPNRKTDTNNHGPMSADNIGFNYDYPDASYERRREIIREHEAYQRGWLYFLATDPRVPADVREEMSRWGLAKDEFQDNGGWPHQLYVREARRMVGTFVMTEHELLKTRPTPEPVGMGSYGIDSHNVQRYITPDGFVQNEGDIGVSTNGPYQIAYGALTPKKGQVDNLLTPVCVSSSHIAFGSIRMEPVFMILGQSAATAAVLALEDGIAVQDLPYDRLRARLLADRQVLEFRNQNDARAALNGALLMTTLTTTRFRRNFLILLVLLVSVAFFAMVQVFLMTILLAALFSGVAYPVYRWLLRAMRGYQTPAAIATLLLLLVLVIAPLLTVGSAVAQEAARVNTTLLPNLQKLVAEPAELDRRLQGLPGFRHIAPYRTQILTKAGELIGATGAVMITALSATTRTFVVFIFHFVVMLYTMYFFLTGGPTLVRSMLAYLPLGDAEKERMLEQFVSVTRATLKGTILIGLAQGVLGGFAFWLVGIQGAILFWGTVMTVLSIVPGIGGALVWVPAAIVLFAIGKAWQALILVGFCALVVGSVDNLLRPILVGRDTQMHELMIFFSTLGGLLIFGAMGFILGPILAALFITVWDMFRTTFRQELADAANAVIVVSDAQAPSEPRPR